MALLHGLSELKKMNFEGAKHVQSYPVEITELQVPFNSMEIFFKNEDGRFDFSPQENSELGKVIQSIIKIGVNEHHNARILDCSVIKTEPKESFLNIFSAKPRLQFLYFAQTDQNSGDIVLDFSTLGGPSFNITKPENGTLIIFPGWIPFRVSKNNSLNDQIIISGYLG